MINYLISIFKFLQISSIGFLSSIILINIIFSLTKNSEISSQITLVVVFFINFYLLKRTFRINSSVKFILILLVFSLSFRVFEFLFFNYLYNYYLNNLNLSWIITLILSFMLKIIVYPVTLKNFN